MRLWLGLALLTVTTLSGSRDANAKVVNPCAPAASDLADIAVVADWLVGLQYDDTSLPSAGALRIHHTPGYVDPSGHAYYLVVPYNAGVALRGLLRAPVRDKLDVTERWLRWHLGHLRPDGQILDHWYLADGTGETTCPPGIDASGCNQADSTDSYAAILLGLAGAYRDAGGNTGVLVENRARLESAAAALLALQQSDGLTWARADFRVKFVFNNAEVYWGLRALAGLERTLFGSRSRANSYDAAAQRVQDGIRRYLTDPKTGLYHVARVEDGSVVPANLSVWYPDTVALTWPHLFGVTTPSATATRTQMAALNAAWDGQPGPDWTTTVVDPDGFLWPAVGYAALLTGDCKRARAQVALVRQERFPFFDYPFTVDDGGWLLATLGDLSH
jgi:hypothetical protein